MGIAAGGRAKRGYSLKNETGQLDTCRRTRSSISVEDLIVARVNLIKWY